jgi:NADPH:quinone reductase-like Zn-dependent oxidoreductase
MKAVVIHEYGGPEVLTYEDVPNPRTGPGEIKIHVHAVSINRVLDVEVRKGNQRQRGVTLPRILGVDPSGIVVEVGPGVGDFKAGDRVTAMYRTTCGVCGPCCSGRSQDCADTIHLGIDRDGGDAEYICVPASGAIPVPERLSFAESSAVSQHAPMAINLLEDMAGLRQGETVLIMGAGGNLGSIGIQVAKALGARVICSAGSEARVDIGMGFGADFGINYNDRDLAIEVASFTGGRGVDVVYDNIANPNTFPKEIASMADGGRLVTAGAHGGPVVALDADAVAGRGLTLRGGTGRSAEQLSRAMNWAASGKINVHISRILPLSAAREAHILMEDPGAGKIVLDPTLDRG